MKTSFALLGLCALLGTAAHAKPSEISFNCGSLWSGGPLRPVRELDALIVQNPRVRRFRIKWNLNGSTGNTWGMALYSRDARTILIENRQDWLLNNDDKPPRRRAQMKRWLVSDVTRARLHQLIRFYQDKSNEEGNDVSFLPQLKRFGCPVRVLADFNHIDPIPQAKAKT